MTVSELIGYLLANTDGAEVVSVFKDSEGDYIDLSSVTVWEDSGIVELRFGGDDDSR